MWVTITLPIICKLLQWSHLPKPLVNKILLVAEVIALKLRRPNSNKEYLYPQIFAGLAFIVASSCLLELWRIKYGWKPFKRRQTVTDHT